MFDSLQYWSSGIIESQLNTPIFFVAVFFLGLIAAIGSCCNVGVLAAVASYAGSESHSKTSHFKTGFSFLIGNIIALSLVGALTGFVSQSIGDSVGQYSKLIAGVVIVYFGLISLNFLPSVFKLSDNLSSKVSKLSSKGFLFGLLLGGFATACSVSCNPIFPVIVGASYLQGKLLLGWFTLFIFAIGYSLPLGGILVGAGVGANKIGDRLLKNKKVLNYISGAVLILLGFGMVLGVI